MTESTDCTVFGDPVWKPPAEAASLPHIERFREWLREECRIQTQTYDQLWQWSTNCVADFWSAIWNYYRVDGKESPRRALGYNSVSRATWFPDSTLNYVDQVFRHADPERTAIIGVPEDDDTAPRTLSWRELESDVASLAEFLRRTGVGPGDRVVGYLPNVPETIVGFLAAASIGAVWSVCGQDYSADSAINRLEQLEPSVLIAADGYRYAGKVHDRRSSLAELRSRMTTLRATVVVSNVGLGLGDLPGVTSWSEATSGRCALQPATVAFDHPLWILFSSGTTGRPKGIVHSHGGVTLEHLKTLNLHFNIDQTSTMFWYTSPSWMVWNFQAGCLLLGATIVCYDGSPFHPGPSRLWQLVADYEITHFGASPAYLRACQERPINPTDGVDLSRLVLLGVTGSVLPAATSQWIAAQLGPSVHIAPVSGGTDIVSALAGPVPTLPTWAGELSARALGVSLESWTPDGHSIIGEVGELVITKPMPSMPIYLWDDLSGSRYQETYFSMYPGAWRHGDWITVTDRGSVIVHGRSDSTLNRNGVRMGSGDIYDIVERIPGISEALILGIEQEDGNYWMPLFIVLAEGVTLDAKLRATISDKIRASASPKHVPDTIVGVPKIPHTHTGKKLEVPVKRALQGAPIASVADSGAVDDISALSEIVRIAQSIHANNLP